MIEVYFILDIHHRMVVGSSILGKSFIMWNYNSNWKLFVIGYWFLIFDYWLLTTDYWLLITDFWFLITDFWSLVTDYWSLITGCWLFVIRASYFGLPRPPTRRSYPQGWKRARRVMSGFKLKRRGDRRRKRLRCASDTTNLQSSIFNSGLSGLGY